MKRKSKLHKSLKGTPPITKFFRRNPGKELNAVVSIPDIFHSDLPMKSVHPKKSMDSDTKMPRNYHASSGQDNQNDTSIHSSLRRSNQVKKRLFHVSNSESTNTICLKGNKSNEDTFQDDLENIITQRRKTLSTISRPEKNNNFFMNDKCRSKSFAEDGQSQNETIHTDESDATDNSNDHVSDCSNDEREKITRNYKDGQSLNENIHTDESGVTAINIAHVSGSSNNEKKKITRKEVDSQSLSESMYTVESDVSEINNDHVFGSSNNEKEKIIRNDKDTKTHNDKKENDNKRDTQNLCGNLNSSSSDSDDNSHQNIHSTDPTNKSNINHIKMECSKGEEDKVVEDVTQGYELDSGKEECRNDDDSSSDDELLKPASFLRNIKFEPDVKTPAKSTTPISGSPLTPVSPYIALSKQVAVTSKYSVHKLLREKPKLAQKQKDIAKMQLDMQHHIEMCKNVNLEKDFLNDDLDDDKDLLPKHQKELEQYQTIDNGFSNESDEYFDMFPRVSGLTKYKNGCCQPFPKVNASKLDKFTEFLYDKCDVEIHELMCGNWLTNYFLTKTCPPAALQWILHVMCYHLDSHTVRASYNVMWSILHVKENKKLSWVPSIQDIVKVFQNYGFDFHSLFENNEFVQFEMVSDLNSSPEKNRSDERLESSFFPLSNLTRFVQVVTLCMNRYPQEYSTQDIEYLFALLYSLALDSRMELSIHDIKTCLRASYDAISSKLWPDEVLKISSLITHINAHHQKKLRIIRLQPYSMRGRDVKRYAAIQTLSSLLKKDEVVDSNVCVLCEANKDGSITNYLELLKALESLVSNIVVSEDTDYYELYTFVELLDIVVGASKLTLSEKEIVLRLRGKLRSLHKDIRDPRAMFISRSKVKDLLIRTMWKFAYMTQGKKGLKNQEVITKFFVEGSSSLKIETLENSELCEEDENGEHQSQLSQMSSFIVDPLSYTGEYFYDERQVSD
ncbi:SMC5-SMC6 complex localization factor protein 2-like [Xenia sp. Carnegie-2017]|uniref:SMC5-SMC6 complex localization factor protein 2-like n=1 Tax=Xenia sp. Carnegie-2017 TaxID=2897299 RepID=UPI001F03E0DA|nr:SMC5-SMC6 complex localization factor protein 2-like [Xenia sp. Carnegie-2017]